MDFWHILKFNFKRVTFTLRGLVITLIFGLSYGAFFYQGVRQWHTFAFSLVYSYCFSLVAPITWQLRLPFLEKLSRILAFGLRALFSLAVDFIFILILFSTYFLLVFPTAFQPGSRSVLLFYVAINTIIFAVVGLFIFQGYQGALELEKGKAREKELEELAARSQLVALRAQINPHFLFNALNSIAELIKTDPDRAEQSVMLLADIFRHSLNIADKQFVALAEEIRFIEAYLAIEKIRFGDRLHVEIETDPQLANLPVPSLILQPLVENAIKHGIARKAEGGHIRISASDRGSFAVLSVSDSGKGIPQKQLQTIFDNGRIGLRNIKERLVKIYGDRYLPQIESREGVGTKITLCIPKET